MVHKRYIIELTAEEWARLKGFVSQGKTSAKAILKTRILLKADQGEGGEGWTDTRISGALETNETMAGGVCAPTS